MKRWNGWGEETINAPLSAKATTFLQHIVGTGTPSRDARGSHLIFPAWRLPIPQALGWVHPLDRRPVSLLPWEGSTLVGTTDSDYTQSLDEEPAIQPEEVAYLRMPT